jgi:hypothetical protein
MSESEEVPDVTMDNCMHCQKEYALIPENACLQIFLKNPECNYVQSICPHCDGHTRMFVGMDSVCGFIDSLPIYVYADATNNIKASQKKVFGEREPEEAAEVMELPDLPPQLRRELWDFLREF